MIAAIIGLAGTLLAVIIPVWISARRDEPSPPRQADRLEVKIRPQSDEPSPLRQADRPGVKIRPQSDEPPPPRQTDSREAKQAPKEPTLDEILDRLDRHHQRATFGAVAGMLGRDPRSLFNGYTRSPKTAWSVNRASGLPTGTKKDEYPPGLLQNKRVIDATEELRVWLREHH